jgi:hypothetical protein
MRVSPGKAEMAKNKIVTHSPTAPAASSPPLAVQIMTALAQLVMVGVFLLGLLVAGTWLVAGFDRYAEQYARVTRPDRPPGTWVHCWRDRYGAEVCRQEDRGPPAYRRHYVSD